MATKRTIAARKPASDHNWKTNAAARYPRRKAEPYPILGPAARRRSLARLTFARFKILLTSDELTELSKRAEDYLSRNGTLFGFVREMLNVQG